MDFLNEWKGIYLYYSNNATVISNTVYDNDRGIQLCNSDNATVSLNTAYDNDRGIHLRYSDYNDVNLNTIYDNQIGIQLCYAYYNDISRNTLTGNLRSGIFLDSSSYNDVETNSITKSRRGIFLQSSAEYNNLTSNTISTSYQHGFLVESSCYNNFSDNTLTTAATGFFFYMNSDDNIILDNTVSNCNHGYLFEDSDNEVTDGTITGSTTYDISIDGTSVVLINNTAFAKTSILVPPDDSGYVDIIWFLDVTADSDADVVVMDGQGSTIYSGTGNATDIECTELRRDKDGITSFNPHRIIVYNSTTDLYYYTEVTMDRDRSITASQDNDSAGPTATANPTMYNDDDRQTCAQNGNTVVLSASISDDVSGVYNATVNVSQISASNEIAMSFVEGNWVSSAVTISATDGTYDVPVVRSYDYAVNGSTDLVNLTVVVDSTTVPAVTSNGTSTTSAKANGASVQLWITGTNISYAEIDLSDYNGNTTYTRMTKSGSNFVYTIYPKMVGTFNFPVKAYSGNGNVDTDDSIDLTVAASDPLPGYTIKTIAATNTLDTGSVNYEKVQVNHQGTKVAFTYYNSTNSDNEIYVMDVDGTDPIRLTNNTECDTKADWSPDDTKIAFTRQTSSYPNIWVINADGTNEKQLTFNYNDEESQKWPEWSPDGTKIAFISHFALDDTISDKKYWTLSVVNADGSNRIDILVPGKHINNGMQFDWSPDSQWIVFSAKGFDDSDDEYRDIYKVRADGTGLTQLTSTPKQCENHVDWSPDGTKILYHADGEYGFSSYLWRSDIWVMNTDGSGKTKMTDFGGYFGSSYIGCDAQPTWSPNGEYIIWKSERNDTTYPRSHLWIMKADGTDKTMLTNFSDYDKKPSVGYQDIAYIKYNSPFEIRVIHFDEAIFEPAPAPAPSKSGGPSVFGGISEEDRNNINTSETVTIYLFADTTVTYNFDDQDVIGSVNFDSLKRSEYVKCLVEVLKGPSTLDDGMGIPPGTVYTYVNIYLGTAGWDNGEKIANPTIDFAVPSDWFTENGIDPASITMYRYHDGEWQALTTTLTGDGDGYYYYTAQTPGFSTFAIVGTADEADSKATEALATPAQDGTAAAVDDETAEPDKGLPGFGIVTAASGVLAALWIVSRRYSKE